MGQALTRSNQHDYYYRLELPVAASPTGCGLDCRKAVIVLRRRCQPRIFAPLDLLMSAFVYRREGPACVSSLRLKFTHTLQPAQPVGRGGH